MTRAIVGRWGEDLAVRIPDEIASALQFRDRDRVEIEAGLEQILIRCAKLQFTLEDMFAGKTAEAWRALYADAYDWGPDVGREVISG